MTSLTTSSINYSSNVTAARPRTKQPRTFQPTFALSCALLFVLSLSLVSTVLANTTQPTILKVFPANERLDVTLTDVVIVWFDEAMNEESINENTFTVTQGAPDMEAYRSRPLAGTISYSYDDFSATFTPDEPFHPNQRFGNVFTATVTPGVQDVDGNPLAREYIWSFSTGESTFRTDATTSQTDQTPNQGTPNQGEPMSPPATTPGSTTTPTAAPSTPTAASTSDIPWGWIALGAFALILLLITLAALASARKEAPRYIQDDVSTNNRASPFGDVHLVSELEGIGTVYAKRLATIGIQTTDELWAADASYIARSIDVPLRTVKSWQHMAELSSVNSIGPQYAELLERSGVHSIASLKESTPDRLLALVQKKQNSLSNNIQGNTIGRPLVSGWIDQARAHRFKPA